MSDCDGCVDLSTHKVVTASGKEFTEEEVRASSYEVDRNGKGFYVVETKPVPLEVEIGGQKYTHWIVDGEYGLFSSAEKKDIRFLKVGTAIPIEVDPANVVRFPSRNGKSGQDVVTV